MEEGGSCRDSATCAPRALSSLKSSSKTNDFLRSPPRTQAPVKVVDLVEEGSGESGGFGPRRPRGRGGGGRRPPNALQPQRTVRVKQAPVVALAAKGCGARQCRAPFSSLRVSSRFVADFSARFFNNDTIVAWKYANSSIQRSLHQEASRLVKCNIP